MSEDRTAPKSEDVRKSYQKVLADSYYGLLGVHPSASMRDIRQAYRDLSKLYHPDTTTLPTAIATAKFQQLNEAYATLSNPERRGVYDRKIGYSRVAVVQPLLNLNTTKQSRKYQSSSAYLDPTDRPLSPGELFALFILGITFVGCLCLAIMVGLTRGETLLQPRMGQNDAVPSVVQPALGGKVTPELPPQAENNIVPSIVRPDPVTPRSSERYSAPSSKTGSSRSAPPAQRIEQPPSAASPTDLPDTSQPIQS